MKLNNYSIASYNGKDVSSAPDILTGTPAQNKARFDALSKDVIIPAFNNLATNISANYLIGSLSTSTSIANMSGMYQVEMAASVKTADGLQGISLSAGETIFVYTDAQARKSLLRIGKDNTLKIYTFTDTAYTLAVEFASAASVSAAVAAVHTHGNKAVLDTVAANSLIHVVGSGAGTITAMSGLYLCMNAPTYFNIQPEVHTESTLGVLLVNGNLAYVANPYVLVFSQYGGLLHYTYTSTSHSLTYEFTTKNYVNSQISAVTTLANNAAATANSAVSGVQAINGERGVTIATLTNGKLTPSQIPPIAINDTFPVANTAQMLTLTAERGDVAIVMSGGVPTDSYILAADDPTVLANWLKMGISYVAEAGHAQTATSAENAIRINGHNLVVMTQAEYDAAVKDANTIYLVG